VVGMEDEDPVHGPRQHRIDMVLLARHRVAHAQEIRGVVELVLGINERLADGIFVGHRSERRQLGDHADGGDVALDRIGNVEGVVIERRQCADRAHHDRHRMRIATEALEEAAHLLVHHGVACHQVVEIVLLSGGGQVAVEQKIAGLEEIAVLGELLDRVAAIEQDAVVAVDIGDLRLAAACRGEAGVVGEYVGPVIERRYIEDTRPDRALIDRKLEALIVQG
jgi:hypothetical protein